MGDESDLRQIDRSTHLFIENTHEIRRHFGINHSNRSDRGDGKDIFKS